MDDVETVDELGPVDWIVVEFPGSKFKGEIAPALVESATWQLAGELDYWVLERGGWWGRVRGPEGTLSWIRAADLRKPPTD